VQLRLQDDQIVFLLQGGVADLQRGQGGAVLRQLFAGQAQLRGLLREREDTVLHISLQLADLFL